MFSISCPDFDNGQPIPQKFTDEGENISPALIISGVPKGTQELALICEDPDAPQAEPWVHWVLYGILPDVSQVPEGCTEWTQGIGSAGEPGWHGPMPPLGHGWHRYFFDLYALDQPLNLPPGLSAHELLKAMRGHILGRTQWVGRYRRDFHRKRAA